MHMGLEPRQGGHPHKQGLLGTIAGYESMRGPMRDHWGLLGVIRVPHSFGKAHW